jgi:2-polyprenyl-3-methyl-5-hydroxy-6-metoxy-1,4-benzoquinol methylase
MINSKEQYNEFAQYYDLLMSDVDYDEWTAYVLNILKKYKTSHRDILEMACGTGNIAVNMAKYGYNVTAFDLSGDMLAVASNKATKNNVYIKFLCQDMRDININNSYGIILCLCDSINYITDHDDLMSVFTWVYKHLKDDGIFIFDINSSYKLRNIIGDNTFTYNEAEIVYIWDNYLTENNSVEFYLTFFAKQGELYRRFDEVHEEKIYEVDEMISFLKHAGFKYISTNEAFSFDCDDENSERINFIVRKYDRN